MLYGYKVMMDNRVATLISAADTVQEYTIWCDNNEDVVDGCLFNECYVSNFMDVLTNEEFKGFKHAVRVFYHDDEAQREEFIKKHSIKLVQSFAARDKQDDMLHEEKATKIDIEKEERAKKWEERQKEIDAITKAFYEDIEKRKAAGEEIPEDEQHIYIENEYAEKTIGEALGLDEYDPWDRRSDEELEHEAKVKDKIEKAKKMGQLSGESFGGVVARKKEEEANGEGTEEAKKEGKVHVRKINVEQNADGTYKVMGVEAIKTGAEVDEDEKRRLEEEKARIAEERKARAKKLTPEDFAKALRGDGRMDSTGGAVIEGEKVVIKDKKSGKKRKGIGG